jgi:SAM-dependent methyltransferase
MDKYIYKNLAIFYDNIYDDKYYVDYSLFIIKAIKDNNIKEVCWLDLACGTGRLINTLKKYDDKIDAEGLDGSENMIVVAKRNNKSVFYLSDFINFDIEKKYNLITCTFDSINYILDDNNLNNFFGRIYKHLENNGLFVFDFNTIYKKVEPILSKKNVVMRNNIVGNMWNIDIEVDINESVYKEKHIEKLYSFDIMNKYLNINKLHIVGIFKDFYNKIDSNNKEPRLFIIARK